MKSDASAADDDGNDESLYGGWPWDDDIVRTRTCCWMVEDGGRGGRDGEGWAAEGSNVGGVAGDVSVALNVCDNGA